MRYRVNIDASTLLRLSITQYKPYSNERQDLHNILFPFDKITVKCFNNQSQSVSNSIKHIPLIYNAIIKGATAIIYRKVLMRVCSLHHRKNKNYITKKQTLKVGLFRCRKLFAKLNFSSVLLQKMFI